MLAKIARFALTTIWPPVQESALDTARARTLGMLSLLTFIVGILTMVFVAPMTAEAFDYNIFFGIYVAVGLFAFPLVFKLTGKLHLATYGAVIYSTIALGAVIVHEGGLLSFNSYQTVPLSAAAIFFCGWRVGLAVSAAVLAGVIGIYVFVGVNEENLPSNLVEYLLLVNVTSIFMAVFLVSAMFAIFGRNFELRDAELEEAKLAAEAASAAKSQFLATMSHEIRTPIQGVLGMADVLVEGSLNSE